MNAKQVLDVKGLACPMPIVKQRRQWKHYNRGSIRSTRNR